MRRFWKIAGYVLGIPLVMAAGIAAWSPAASTWPFLALVLSAAPALAQSGAQGNRDVTDGVMQAAAELRDGDLARLCYFRDEAWLAALLAYEFDTVKDEQRQLLAAGIPHPRDFIAGAFKVAMFFAREDWTGGPQHACDQHSAAARLKTLDAVVGLYQLTHPGR